jgi:hypothetical protein
VAEVALVRAFLDAVLAMLVSGCVGTYAGAGDLGRDIAAWHGCRVLMQLNMAGGEEWMTGMLDLQRGHQRTVVSAATMMSALHHTHTHTHHTMSSVRKPSASYSA